MTAYDPSWPFPQFDDSGKQLLPANWNQRQTRPNPTEGAEDAPF